MSCCPRCRSTSVNWSEEESFCRMCGHKWPHPIKHCDDETMAAARAEADAEAERQARIADAVAEAAAERVPPPGGWT